jgi:hypothetical protein
MFLRCLPIAIVYADLWYHKQLFSPSRERRKSLATAEGRGFETKSDEPQRGERIFRRYRGLCAACILIHGLSGLLPKKQSSQFPPYSSTREREFKGK